MANNNHITDKQKELLEYLIEKTDHFQGSLPSINCMSEDLGISPVNLREQIAFLKTIGVINAKPRKGIHLLDYQFTPAVAKSLYYAVKLDEKNFIQYSELRNHLEKSFFIEAACKINATQLTQLMGLISKAKEKLNGEPIQIPHQEHRNFHLGFYKPLNNIFLTGLLEAYWDTYELIGLDFYADLDYLEKVWDFHERILDKVIDKDYENGYDLLVEHMLLIYSR